MAAAAPRLAPLTLKRYPEGVDQEFFYEKRCPPHRPDWIASADIPGDRHGTIRYCTVDSLPALVWVANLASLEFHTLLATAEHPDQPTMMVFDLDPGEGVTTLDSGRVARLLQRHLARQGLESFAKTSGGKGVHLYVPLNTPVTHDQTKTFARETAERFARNHPERITSNMRKSLRAGKVFIDWSQKRLAQDHCLRLLSPRPRRADRFNPRHVGRDRSRPPPPQRKQAPLRIRRRPPPRGTPGGPLRAGVDATAEAAVTK